MNVELTKEDVELIIDWFDTIQNEFSNNPTADEAKHLKKLYDVLEEEYIRTGELKPRE
jgi:hypothetical protein